MTTVTISTEVNTTTVTTTVGILHTEEVSTVYHHAAFSTNYTQEYIYSTIFENYRSSDHSLVQLFGVTPPCRASTFGSWV